MHGRFEIYTETEASEIEVAGQRVPLEYETTSALAYGLGRSTMWDFEIAGFRSGDLLRTRDNLLTDDGLLMLKPYRTGKIPIPPYYARYGKANLLRHVSGRTPLLPMKLLSAQRPMAINTLDHIGDRI